MPSVKLMWSISATLFTQLCLGFYSLETPLEEKLLLMRIWPTFFLSILSILPSYLLLWNRPHICLMTIYCVLRECKSKVWVIGDLLIVDRDRNLFFAIGDCHLVKRSPDDRDRKIQRSRSQKCDRDLLSYSFSLAVNLVDNFSNKL